MLSFQWRFSFFINKKNLPQVSQEVCIVMLRVANYINKWNKDRPRKCFKAFYKNCLNEATLKLLPTQHSLTFIYEKK